MQTGDLVRIKQDDPVSRGYWTYWIADDPTLADATIICVHSANPHHSSFKRLDGEPWPDGSEAVPLLNAHFVSV